MTHNYQNHALRGVGGSSANRRESESGESEFRWVGAKNAIIPVAELMFLYVAVVVQTINMLALMAALLWVFFR